MYQMTDKHTIFSQSWCATMRANVQPHPLLRTGTGEPVYASPPLTYTALAEALMLEDALPAESSFKQAYFNAARVELQRFFDLEDPKVLAKIAEHEARGTTFEATPFGWIIHIHSAISTDFDCFSIRNWLNANDLTLNLWYYK